MRKTLFFITCLSLFSSCTDEKDESGSNEDAKEVSTFLPFDIIALNQTMEFKDIPENWKLAGAVYADSTQGESLKMEEGKGILVNFPNAQNKGHLLTNLEHGDIELEVDVMMPKGSNSGLYFQGRYEVQLLDSWGKKAPEYLDMGGIYHRWDDTRGKGNEGYEGSAPRINAAKAPGLWQHLKIIFHAPRFNAQGEKTKNAEFEEVWLNGVLVQENVEVTGPTRASAFDDEKPQGPFMVQGDHGAVALKHLKYKRYNGEKIRLTDMILREYPSDSVKLVNLDSLTPEREVTVDSIAATMASGKDPQKILSFNGKMILPETGKYLFDYRIHENGGILIVDSDTIINLDGDYKMDSLGIGRVELNAGEVPFQLIYNKHRYWKQGFSFDVEGPGVEKQALHSPSSLDRTGLGAKGIIMLPVTSEVVLQRSFWMHRGKKRTHCIAVGSPLGIHYAYDLDNGALLQAWNGPFFDASELWVNRGEKQLGIPAGFTIAFHGDVQFANLKEPNAPWPTSETDAADFKSEGYYLDSDGLPEYQYRLGSTEITDGLKPSSDIRALKRSISFDGSKNLNHKVAEGTQIKLLPDGTYIVNDESYFVKFASGTKLKPRIRQSNGKDELILEIPGGTHTLNYSIIW